MNEWIKANPEIVALRNERGNYNIKMILLTSFIIVALRNERGNYNFLSTRWTPRGIVALRNERGNYNLCSKWCCSF